MKQFIHYLFFLLACCPAASAQLNWQPTNGPEGGASGYIYGNDQYAFFPASRYLFRTADGANWERLPHADLWPIGIGADKIVALQGYENGYSLINGNHKFLVSYDNGTTWIEGSLPPTSYGFCFNIAVCSHGIYVPGGAQNRIFRSQDDGLTWDTIIAPGEYCYDIYAFEDRVYTGYWRLANNATDWESVAPNAGTLEDPNSMLAFGPNLFFSTLNSLYASADNGVTWHTKTVTHNNTGDNFTRVGNRVYRLAGITGLMYTDDFGVTWNDVPLTTDHGALDLSAAGGKLLAASYEQGILSFDEVSNELKSASHGLTSAVVHGLEVGAMELWAACGNGVFAYDLATQQWVDKALLPLPHDRYRQVAISKSGKIAALGYTFSPFFYLSSDNGASWDTIHPGATQQWPNIYFEKIMWLDDVLLLLDHSGLGVIRSVDFGQTWQELTDAPQSAIAFNGKYFSVNYLGSVISSSDLGLTWQISQSPPLLARVLYTSGDRLFCVATYQNVAQTVLYSTVDGVNWKYSNDGLPLLTTSPFSYARYNIGNIWNRNGKYYFNDMNVGFFVSLDTCKTWLPIQRKTYGQLAMVDTTLYYGSFGEGVLKAGLPQNYGTLSSGVVYKDDNSNGIKDAGEIVLPHFQVMAKEPNFGWQPWFTTTDAAGHYTLGTLPSGNSMVLASTTFQYIDTIIPPLYIVNSSAANRDFGVHFTENIRDVSIVGAYTGLPRPGFDLNTHMQYGNDGTLPATGVISVKLDPEYQYIGAIPAPSAIFGDSLIWNYADLPLFEDRKIVIQGKIAPTAILGSTIKTKGYIEAAGTDKTLGNNYFTLSDMVVGAYDPNEKRVEPAAGLTPAEIAAGKELLYTIQFQNTGTYEAERVRITDHLDTALNFNTLRLVSASHDISRFQLLPGGLLEVVFDHIALPDSNADEAASHGFVTFAIQRNKAFNASPYNIINNKAAIYFDFNEPIITNTVASGLILTPVGTDEPKTGVNRNPELYIAPNPTNGYFSASTKAALDGPGTLTLLNTAGQVCLQQPVKDLSQPVRVNTLLLADGLYIVQLSSKTNVLTAKVLVQHY